MLSSCIRTCSGRRSRQQPSDGPQMMGTLEIIAPDNAHIIDPIYPHFYRSMNDLMSVQKNAHMCNSSFLIVEKSQVTCPGFFQEAHRLTLCGLLVGVAQQWDI